MIDTGASISLIHDQPLQQMCHDPVYPCSLKEVHTANSGFISLLGMVRLYVQINDITTEVTAYVTRDLVCPMILGRDWIQKHYVTIDFAANRISLYDGITSVPLLPSVCIEPFVFSSSDSIIIPPFHEKLVSGYAPVQTLDNALFTPNSALQHSRLILIPHSILHIRDHHGVISIMNNTRHPKVIPPHTPLGTISSRSAESDLNNVHQLSSDSSSFPPVLSTSFSCAHCHVPHSSTVALYEHLRLCCNKTSSCSSDIIHESVGHLVDSNQRMSVYLLLHQYHSLFDNDCTQGIACPPQRAIHTGSHAPLADHPRRTSFHNRQIIADEVQRLLHDNIISPSNSPWASPVVIVKKSDGSPRFCVDYRRLNSITRKDVYPIPRIDDLLDRLHGSCIFSKLDLRSGYFQVPLAPCERPKTAFLTPDGLWQFNRLPQGLKNSPAVFQRLMNQTIGSLRWDVCLAYLDDLVVYSPSFDQHLLDVQRVCHVLHSANFKLNSDKCAFFRSEISFLGHKINAEGCSPTDDNTRSITQFPVPTSSKAAHSFLQMIGFYRKYIPRFAHISAPLNKFTRKGFPFVWTDVEQSAFDQLKQSLTSPAILVLPDPTKPYVVRTDASRVGVGGVLLQEQLLDSTGPSAASILKPVAFASRSLKPAEKNYSAIELECLAVWWCINDKFHPYIEGQRLILETDHKPLLSLMKKPYRNARIERWMTDLQHYDMCIQHISGTTNVLADALSRYPVDTPDTVADDQSASSNLNGNVSINAVTTRSMTRRDQAAIFPAVSLSSSSSISTDASRSSSSHLVSTPSCPLSSNNSIFLDFDLINRHQNRDPSLSAIKSSQPLDPSYMIDQHGVLHKQITRCNGQVRTLCYIPPTLVPTVLLTYHNSTFSGAHYGITRTFYKLRDRFYWPHMYQDIVRHISSCISCKKNKPSRKKPDGHLHSISPPQGVWERIAMDYVGPVPESKSGNKYFLVLTDLLSKFVVTKAVPDCTSLTAAKFLLYDVFLIYGVPLEIITDNGQHFSSSLYKSLLTLTGCCHVKTSPYNPRANGLCERHNATLVPNLVSLSNTSRSNWDEKLGPTTFNYNTTRHASTGFTPFELMFARFPRLIADLPSAPSISSHLPQYHHTMSQFIEHIKLAARNNHLHHQRLAKSRYDQHRANPQYSIGENVFIRNRTPPLNKFSSKFIGPYTVMNKLHDKTYLVQHPITGHQRQVLVSDLRSVE